MKTEFQNGWSGSHALMGQQEHGERVQGNGGNKVGKGREGGGIIAVFVILRALISNIGTAQAT